MKKYFSPNHILWTSFLLLAVLAPLLTGEYIKSLFILICIWIMMTTSINLIYGYTGQLSLGHAAFFGIGAYAMGILTVKVGLSFWLAFLVSIGITGIGGLLIGFTSLRLKGPYFVLVTLSFAIIIHMILVHWHDLTGGANGLMGIPRPPTIPLPFGAEINFKSQLSVYYLILFFLALITLINNRLVNSLVGKSFIAISRDENLAQSLGINTMRRKLLSFVISTVYAGTAGILYATYNSVITPQLSHFTQGMNAVAYLVIGGSATMAGPFIGTILLAAIPEVLQVVPRLLAMINGIILLIFIIFFPSGIAGGFRFLFKKLHSKRMVQG
ncbi:branched-chain amino acid ABC transporter permease [Thermodesulfobacteriota bacterium]